MLRRGESLATAIVTRENLTAISENPEQKESRSQRQRQDQPGHGVPEGTRQLAPTKDEDQHGGRLDQAPAARPGVALDDGPGEQGGEEDVSRRLDGRAEQHRPRRPQRQQYT